MTMAKKPTIILGIDPGTRITGYGLIRTHGPSFETIDYGCIRPPATAELPVRYHVLFESVEALLQKYQPDAISIETQYVNKNPQSTMKLAMARAVVLILSAKYTIPIFEYTPSRAKKAISGSGSSDKRKVQVMIQHLLRLPKLPTPEDAADALALAICHANTQRIPCTLTSKGR